MSGKRTLIGDRGESKSLQQLIVIENGLKVYFSIINTPEIKKKKKLLNHH